MIKFRCSKCNQKIAVSETAIGKKVKCPKCQTVLTIPQVTKSDSIVMVTPLSETQVSTNHTENASGFKASEPTIQNEIIKRKAVERDAVKKYTKKDITYAIMIAICLAVVALVLCTQFDDLKKELLGQSTAIAAIAGFVFVFFLIGFLVGKILRYYNICKTTIGTMLILGGMIGVIYFFFIFDTSIEVPVEYVAGQSIDGGRVNNFGLMADRQNGLIFSFGLIGVGFVIEAFKRWNKLETY